MAGQGMQESVDSRQKIYTQSAKRIVHSAERKGHRVKVPLDDDDLTIL